MPDFEWFYDENKNIHTRCVWSKVGDAFSVLHDYPTVCMLLSRWHICKDESRKPNSIVAYVFILNIRTVTLTLCCFADAFTVVKPKTHDSYR